MQLIFPVFEFVVAVSQNLKQEFGSSLKFFVVQIECSERVSVDSEKQISWSHELHFVLLKVRDKQ